MALLLSQTLRDWIASSRRILEPRRRDAKREGDNPELVAFIEGELEILYQLERDLDRAEKKGQN